MKTIPLKKMLVLIAVLLMVNTFSVAFIKTASATSSLPEYQSVDWQSGLAGKVEMPSIGDLDSEFAGAQEVSSFVSAPAVGTKAYDWYLRAISLGTPTGSQPWMTLMAISGNVEVWVQDYRWFLPGDPRNDDPYNLEISPAMAQYLADEFNNVIYPTDTTYFGAPFDRDGTNTIFQQLGWPAYYWDWIDTDNPQRVILKVLNIRDENYNDPTYPYYTAGFFSPTYTQVYYNRNMIHIDAWRWWQRLGPAGTVWFSERPDLVNNRPYVYETTTIHEFQHNIHRDWNPDSPSFMNEGASMYSEILGGYGVDWSYLNSYLYTPDNSLTVWGDQGDINILADYGAAAMWAIYLSDHYGGPAILSTYVQDGIPGIPGVDAALASLGYTNTFVDVYHDWRIANLIHTSTVGKVATPQYNYVSIDLGSAEAIQARTYKLKKPLYGWTKGSAFGTTITILDYDTGVSLLPEYGSDYIQYNTREGLNPMLNFDGDDRAGFAWERVDKDGDGDLEWYSTVSDNLADISIIGTVDLSGMTTATLTFDAWVDTEPLWDFGFVQVSTDGVTWTSLTATHTTTNHDPSAHPDIIANLPGYTGDSAGWLIGESADLTPYVGGSVMLRFRYMTDWGALYPGWWVDNIAINNVVVDNADNTVAFVPVPPKPETDFMVTIVGWEIDQGMPKYKTVIDVALDDLTETGMAALTGRQMGSYMMFIISPKLGPADYMFSVTRA